MILSDGIIGQMMEKVVISRQEKRKTDQQIEKESGGWATIGERRGKPRNIITSLCLDPVDQEETNVRLQAKYRLVEEREVRFQEYMTEDADYVMVAFGSSARVASEVVNIARAEGYKVGLLRPITLWPFPSRRVAELASRVKGFLSVELNAGQMVEDVRLHAAGRTTVEHFGRMGGMVYSPEDVYTALKSKLINR
jgi:2-oxoglutarate ferredoxin oxidoreductase subunit alpha